MLSSEAWQCLVAMGTELVGEGSLAALEGTAASLHWPWNATLGRGNWAFPKAFSKQKPYSAVSLTLLCQLTLLSIQDEATLG